MLLIHTFLHTFQFWLSYPDLILKLNIIPLLCYPIYSAAIYCHMRNMHVSTELGIIVK